MIGKFKFYALIAMVCVVKVNCIQVVEEAEVNATEIEAFTKASNHETTESSKVENHENTENADDSSTTTDATTHKIPPTLLNTKIDYKPKPSEKSLKDISPTTAHFYPKRPGQAIDLRVKQAVLYSKENAFKNLNNFNPKNEKKLDQDAKSNQVQADISKDRPKEFQPSPELSPLYNRENQVQDHFNPMNQYYKPGNQDARFPNETPFNVNPILDTRWLGGNQPSRENRQPSEHMLPPTLIQQARTTNIDFPAYFNSNNNRQLPSEDRIRFPTGENFNHIEPKHTNWHSQQVPALNFKQPKGIWKWIPDDDSENHQGTEPPTPVFYEPSATQTSRDRPYSFVEPDPTAHGNPIYSNYQQSSSHFADNSFHKIPTGPGGWPSSGGSETTLLTTEEYVSGKQDDHKIGNIDLKR